MGLSSNLNGFLKTHGYSIITALVIGLLMGCYVLFILPANERKEDADNIAALRGIAEQFREFVDDKLNEVGPEKKDSVKLYDKQLAQQSVAGHYYISFIKAGTDPWTYGLDKKAKFGRLIYFKSLTDKNDSSVKISKDKVEIDFSEFRDRVTAITKFNAFYMCPVDSQKKCNRQYPLLADNISLNDQDSLAANSRNNGPFSFKSSPERYYADQITISGTNTTFFIAAGVSVKDFQSVAREINSTLLIFCLLITIVLALSISFIKPIISSYKERLSQTDLVSVTFSIGALASVLVVFFALYNWNKTIDRRNQRDLEQLVTYIDTSFKQQVNTYTAWKKNDTISIGKIFKDSNDKFLKINKQAFAETIKAQHFPTSKTSYDSVLIEQLDTYFQMDSSGLITTNINKDTPGIRRQYADRIYFKMIKKENMDTVLTGVFSRETNEYQWIYAFRNGQAGRHAPGDGIAGIAFRETFSKGVQLPPGTDYMIVDRKGDVLMHNNPRKDLYQNLVSGSGDNPGLVSVLSGAAPASFQLDYQGGSYQVYAVKASVKSDFPVYILGIREQSHLNRLSLYTFSNGFLLAVFYGIFVLTLTLFYSSLFYSARFGLFSRQHFYFLFPDNTRKAEYNYLVLVNAVSIALGLFLSLFCSPSMAIICCAVLGVNTAFVDFVLLNIRSLNPAKELVRILLVLLLPGICLPLVALSFGHYILAACLLFGTHSLLIFYYRGWRKRLPDNTELFAAQNQGVQRKAYTRFISVILMNHFALFPFILASALYISDLDDYARYYCSPPQVKVQGNTAISKTAGIASYGCSCDSPFADPVIFSKANELVAQKANIGFLKRPVMIDIRHFSFDSLSPHHYFSFAAVLENDWEDMLLSVAGILMLCLLVYGLVNIYSNRFFFYDLMQAAYKGYYPLKKNALSSDHVYFPMYSNEDINNLIQGDENPGLQAASATDDGGRKVNIAEVFEDDGSDEIKPIWRVDFIINSNLQFYGKIYEDLWKSLPDDETRNVLFDFARDHFVNYKNKEILMKLMDRGIINHDLLTGRLKIMSLNFRIYIMTMSKRDDEFIDNFEKESKNGTYGRWKFPILILVTSILLLLMYLNRDSYDRIEVMGSCIGAALLLVNRFLSLGKNP